MITKTASIIGLESKIEEISQNMEKKQVTETRQKIVKDQFLTKKCCIKREPTKMERGNNRQK